MRDHAVAFWITLAIDASAIGNAPIAGRILALSTRDAAIAFAIGTVLPQPAPLHGLFAAGGLLVIVIARAADHALFGPLPSLAGGIALDRPHDLFGKARFAVTYGAAATVALWLGRIFDAPHAPWVVFPPSW